jgi:hypothetical protein
MEVTPGIPSRSVKINMFIERSSLFFAFHRNDGFGSTVFGALSATDTFFLVNMGTGGIHMDGIDGADVLTFLTETTAGFYTIFHEEPSFLA